MKQTLFFAIALCLILVTQKVVAGTGNGNTLPNVYEKTLVSDSTLGIGGCSNGMYIVGQSFDAENPKFPYKILVRITFISEDGEMSYRSLTKEGATLEELYDEIDYDSGYANFTIDLGKCSNKPQTVSITSIFRMDNERVELFTNSTPLVKIPKLTKK